MSAAQLHPELGMPEVREEPGADGGYVMNFAAVVELARTCGTLDGRILYPALLAAWRGLESVSISKSERQERALREGLAVLERSRLEGPLQ